MSFFPFFPPPQFGPGPLPPGPVTEPSPNLTNFTRWVRNVMGVPAAYLPDNSPFFSYAYVQSFDVVNRDFGCLNFQTGYFSPYELAIYNLAGHLLIEFATDVSYPIVAASWLGGQVTLTTQQPNSIVVGDQILVAGISPNPYNTPPGSAFTVYSIVDTQNFTYTLPNPNSPGPYPNPGLATIPASGATVSEWYWGRFRKEFRITSFTQGIVSNAGDVSTSAGLVVPEFMKELTIFDLSLTKTPFGRTYLSLAQRYGPSIFGLTR